jgi:Zn-finger nucleic acid-binding protein
MYCPTCTTVRLALAERQGIEIDYCPTCRGVWLDRGELDKLIGRAGPAHELSETQDGDGEGHDGRGRGGLFGGLGRKRGRRESMLGDLFDFS